MTPAGAKQLFLANRVLAADEARSIGIVDNVAETFEDELQRISGLDPHTTRFLKELTRHGDRLTASQRLLLAARLGRLYDL